eukprot:357577-Amphidinium_carterae.1
MEADTSRHQHLWQRLAEALRDRPWQILKTKAHRAAPTMGDPARWEWQGNDRADHFAGLSLRRYSSRAHHHSSVLHRLPQLACALSALRETLPLPRTFMSKGATTPYLRKIGLLQTNLRLPSPPGLAGPSLIGLIIGIINSSCWVTLTAFVLLPSSPPWRWVAREATLLVALLCTLHTP